MPEKAREKAELVLKKEPKNEEALLLQASVLLSRKEIAKARTQLEEMIKGGMTKQDEYMLLTATYVLDKDTKGLEKALQEGIAANPKSIPLNLGLAQFYTRTGRADNAVALVQKVITIEPDQINHRFTLAGLYWGTGNEQKARKSWTD